MGLTQRDSLAHNLHEHFQHTPEGQTLKANVRYERYKPEHISNAEWEKLLGADVNNLHHLPLTHNLTAIYLKHYPSQEYSPEEQEILLTTAITHDWAESIIGDISYDEKQDHHEEEEHTILEKLLKEVLHSESTLSKDIVDTVKNRETKLGKTFNMIERFGYLRTALRAWEKRKSIEDQELSEKLAWLTSNVLLNNLPALLTLAKEYEGIRSYLAYNAEHISEACRAPKEEIFAHTKTPKEDEVKWEIAKYLWEKYQTEENEKMDTFDR